MCRERMRNLCWFVAVSLVFTLLGCGGGSPPKETIKNAVVDTLYPGVNPRQFTFESFQITNNYTKKMAGETYYVYECDVVGKMEYYRPQPDGKGGYELKGTGEFAPVNQAVTVALVKRGERWYNLK